MLFQLRSTAIQDIIFDRILWLTFTSPEYAHTPVMLSDVQVHQTSILISVRQSRCDQISLSQSIELTGYPEIAICHVKAILAFLTVRPNVSNYMFVHNNGKPVTRYQFSYM